MAKDDFQTEEVSVEEEEVSVEENDAPESPARRDMLRRLAKGGAVIPVAAVIYNASTTVAAAED